MIKSFFPVSYTHLPRYHRDVAGILVHVGGLAHHDGNFLALLQLQQVGNVAALGLSLIHISRP